MGYRIDTSLLAIIGAGTELELVADGHPGQCVGGRRYASMDGGDSFCSKFRRLHSEFDARQHVRRCESISDQR